MASDHIEVAVSLRAALTALVNNKPKDRSRTDRDYQIVITDLEKLIAFFEHRVVEGKE